MKRILEKAEHLSAIVSGLKSQGKAIVLALGSFENLRPEDIEYLEDARIRGDYLVVGVSASWPASKGKSLPGPKVALQSRAIVLDALRCVDYVTFFAEDHAEKILQVLKPNLFAINANWGSKSLQEQAAARAQVEILICGDKKQPGPGAGVKGKPIPKSKRKSRLAHGRR